jgi:hypothetical protein
LNNFYTKLQQSLGHNTVKYIRSTAEKIYCILVPNFYWGTSRHFRVGPGLKPVRNYILLNTGIPVLKKLGFKNLLKISFGEGQVQGPISALLGHESEIPASQIYIGLSLYSNFQLSRCKNCEKIGNRRTDGQRNDFNSAQLLKSCSQKRAVIIFFQNSYGIRFETENTL